MKPFEHFGIEVEKDKFHESAVYGLACAYSLLEREIAGYLRPFGLTPAKFNCLMVIKHKGRDTGLSQVEIGTSLIVTASNITRLLDRLGREGLIERTGKEKDRRVNLIKISKKGSSLLDRVWPGYYKKLTELAGLLNKEELKRTSELIIKWCARLQENR